LSAEARGLALRLLTPQGQPVDEMTGGTSAALVACHAEPLLLETELTERAGTLELQKEDLGLTTRVARTHPRALARLLTRLLDEPGISPREVARQIEPVTPSTDRQPESERSFEVPAGGCLDLSVSREDGQGWVGATVTQASAPERPTRWSGVGQLRGRSCQPYLPDAAAQVFRVSLFAEPPTPTVLLLARVTAAAGHTSPEPAPHATPAVRP